MAQKNELVQRKEKENVWRLTHLRAKGKDLLRRLLELKLPECVNEPQPAPSPPFIGMKR